jgi:hypothetical protein
MPAQQVAIVTGGGGAIGRGRLRAGYASGR